MSRLSQEFLKKLNIKLPYDPEVPLLGIQAYFMLLCFALLYFADIVFFYKLKLCGNSAPTKSISTVFPAAFVHFMALCHILLIPSILQAFHQQKYYESLKDQMTVSRFYQ